MSRWDSAEVPSVGQLSSEIEAAQKGERFTEANRIAGLETGREGETSPSVDQELGALSPAVRRGQEEEAKRAGIHQGS
jgi:hypothetical protein